jgi:hypothetical protein
MRKFTTASPKFMRQLINGTGNNEILVSAFVWAETAQGHEYWAKRFEEHRKGKRLSKTAKGYVQSILNMYCKQHPRRS